MPDNSSAIAEKAAKTVQIPAADGRVDPKALRAALAARRETPLPLNRGRVPLVRTPRRGVVVGFGQRFDGEAIDRPPGHGG